MKVIILAGGFGTRLSEETVVRPKPMVEIGGRPILWHILKHYAHYGFNEFIIALGYKGHVIKDYFLDYYHLESDLTVNLGTGDVTVREQRRENWVVHLVDTGYSALTGARIKRVRDYIGHSPFMLTYGDGVSDVNLHDLVAYHQQQRRLATITAVRPPARFGRLDLHDDAVVFNEKPQSGEGWINGGYMVFEPAILDYLPDGDNVSMEHVLMETLSPQGQISAYRHTGYWQCMDTLRDKQTLENLWQSGSPPWKVWP
jgi:glucose-1-phosphate cytidylyltransferase